MHFADFVLFVAVNERRDSDQFPTLFGEFAKFASIDLVELAGRRFAREDRKHFKRRVRGIERPLLREQQSERGEAYQSENRYAFHVKF